MGLFDKLARAATGMGPVEAVMDRCLNQAQDAARAGHSETTLIVTQADVGVRNQLELLIPRIVGRLQDEDLQVLSTEGGTGWDRTLRIRVDVSSLMGSAPAASPDTEVRKEVPLGELIQRAPATLESRLAANANQVQELGDPARVDVYENALQIHTPAGLYWGAEWGRIVEASYIWKYSRMRFEGSPESWLIYEFVRANEGGSLDRLVVNTGHPGLDGARTPSDRCFEAIKVRTNLVRWNGSNTSEARMLPEMGESMQEVPEDWHSTVTFD